MRIMHELVLNTLLLGTATDQIVNMLHLQDNLLHTEMW